MKIKFFKNNTHNQWFLPLAILLAFAFTLVGCEEDEKPVDEPTLEVAPATVPAFTTDGGTYTITLTSNTAWTVEVTPANTWCDVSPTKGDGNNPVVRLTVQTNAHVEGRAATATFTAGALIRQVAISQVAAAPILEVTPATIAPANTGGTHIITVTSNTTWTVSDNADWLTLSAADGNGNGVITIDAQANLTFVERPATVTFTSGALTRQVAVTQAAGVATLIVEPTAISVGGAENSTGTVTVTSNSTWTVSDNATWLSVSPTSGTNSGAVTVTATQANPNPAARSATVTFTYGNAQTKTVVVTQDVSPPAYAATTQTWTFGTRTWSDMIQIPGCNIPIVNYITTFNTPQCASATVDGKVYYFYNKVYFVANATNLCPSPWRVATREDLNALVASVPQVDLWAAWGRPGYAYANADDTPGVGFADAQGVQLLMFSTPGDYFLNNEYEVNENMWLRHGLPVRCVRNN
jgi:hypothetical protein